MFLPFLPNPTRIDFPAFTAAGTYDVELAHSIDVSSSRYGALYLRVHDNIGVQTNFRMQLVGYPIWPDESTGPRRDITALFQNTGVTTLITADMTNNTTNGELITRIVSGGVEPISLVMPAVRILAHFYPTGAINAGYIVISAGILLLES